MIKEVINKLLVGNYPNAVELREVYEEILSGLCDEISASSFLSLLHNQGFSEDNLCLFLQCAKNAIKPVDIRLNQKNIIENISFSLNNIYLDVLLAQDIICSACDLGVSRYSYNTPFLKDNTFNILSLLGVEIDNDVDYLGLDYEKLNFNYFYLSTDDPYFKYGENLRQNLPFDNIFNQSLKLLNPLGVKNLFLAVKDKNLVERYASLALKLQKENSIILSSDTDFALINPAGETYIAEAWKNKVFTYALTPELFGVESVSIDELKIENNEHNAQVLNSIFENKVKDSRYNAVVLNTGLSLYIAKMADSIMDGMNLAKNTIESGRAFEKLEQLRKFYN